MFETNLLLDFLVRTVQCLRCWFVLFSSNALHPSVEIVVDSEIVLDTSCNQTSLLNHILDINTDLGWWHLKRLSKGLNTCLIHQ